MEKKEQRKILLSELLKMFVINAIKYSDRSRQQDIIKFVNNMEDIEIIDRLPLGMLDLLKIEKC